MKSWLCFNNGMTYEPVIGLEIHLQLKTRSKMFCDSPNVLGEADPNTAVCPVCMGHPGTLPVLNREAVRQGMRLALALHATVAHETRFDRKNYFYPDLPKGYQISQFDRPLATGGHVAIDVGGEMRSMHLERLHLEEDAAKNFHRGDASLIDFNRAGAPLAEIVTKPEFRSPEEAKLFLQELRLIARYLDVSDADMEKGHLRCDANISLRPKGEQKLYPKIEVKNLNSFKAVEKALAHEIERQRAMWERGERPQHQETRGWDERKLETVHQRTKEGMDDYRYFPEPDLPPLVITDHDIDGARVTIPELPAEKRSRLVKEYAMDPKDAALIVSVKANAEFFEQVIEELKNWIFDVDAKGAGSKDALWDKLKARLVKLAYSWITSELFKHLNADGKEASDMQLTPENMAELVALVYEGKLSSSAAQTILDIMYHEGGEPSDIANDRNLFQVNDESDIRDLVKEVLAQQQEQVQEYLTGKHAVLQFLVGKVMRLSKGSANPEVVTRILTEELEKMR